MQYQGEIGQIAQRLHEDIILLHSRHLHREDYIYNYPIIVTIMEMVFMGG